MLKFCANVSFMFNEYENVLVRYEKAKQANFTAVENPNPYAIAFNNLKDIHKIGLQHALINTPTGKPGQNGLAAIPGEEQEFKVTLDKAILYAQTLNCPIIHILAAITPMNGSELLYDFEDMEKTYLENLKYASQKLKQLNLIGVIEPICPQAVPNYFLNSFPQAMKYILHINESSIKLLLDFYHLQRLHGNLTENVIKIMPFVGHIQISQVPGRHEPDSCGEINYQYIFDIIKIEGYEGYIGLEYKPKGDTIEGLKWINKFKY